VGVEVVWCERGIRGGAVALAEFISSEAPSRRRTWLPTLRMSTNSALSRPYTVWPAVASVVVLNEGGAGKLRMFP
jgi:hypothetical protein